MSTESLAASLEAFLTEAASWLTNAERPLVASLRMMARTLDQQDEDGVLVASLLSTYARELARLHKLKPVTPPVDPLAAALDALNESPTTNDSHDS